MKAAMVLTGTDQAAAGQAALISRLMADSGFVWTDVEVWQLFSGDVPIKIPVVDLPVTRVRMIETLDPDLPEAGLSALETVCRKGVPDILFFGANGQAGELATRLGFRLGTQSCLGVETLEKSDINLSITTRAYAGNLRATFEVPQGGLCLAAAPEPLPELPMAKMDEIKIEVVPAEPETFGWVVSKHSVAHKEDTQDNALASASFVLAAGMGAGSRAGVEDLKRIAGSMGAVLGGSRPVVMNAWLPMADMIGVSGKLISPDICIAAGVSGTGAFEWGVAQSGFVLAVNSDSKAPVFEWAHAGVTADLFEFLNALATVISQDREQSGKNGG